MVVVSGSWGMVSQGCGVVDWGGVVGSMRDDWSVVGDGRLLDITEGVWGVDSWCWGSNDWRWEVSWSWVDDLGWSSSVDWRSSDQFGWSRSNELGWGCGVNWCGGDQFSWCWGNDLGNWHISRFRHDSIESINSVSGLITDKDVIKIIVDICQVLRQLT